MDTRSNSSAPNSSDKAGSSRNLPASGSANALQNTGKAIGRFLLRLAALLLALMFLVLIASPMINNLSAWKTGQEVARLPLPPDTEIKERFSRAGKLNGNGNGMQFLGGILIRSGLTLEELQDYYASVGDSYIVERQETRELAMVEHDRAFLETDVSRGGYYVVYTWGNGIFPFYGLDLRGH